MSSGSTTESLPRGAAARSTTKRSRRAELRENPIIWWISVALWLALISTLSSRVFGFDSMFRFLAPFLHREAPVTSDAVWSAGLLALRKLAHFSEYAVLALLTWTALRRQFRDRNSLVLTLAIAALCGVAALGDEYRQTFVPGRAGQLSDVAIDLFGSLSMLGLLWLRRGALSLKSSLDDTRGNSAARALAPKDSNHCSPRP